MRNPYALHLNFTELVGAIPEIPKILPSNIDMMYERCGKFLVAEWKRPNEKISIGQSILLKALARQDDFIVLIITGDTDRDMQVFNVERLNEQGELIPKGNTLEDLKTIILKWYNWANEEKK
jgi:hypothetical protein